jgi:hypothetical protein
MAQDTHRDGRHQADLCQDTLRRDSPGQTVLKLILDIGEVTHGYEWGERSKGRAAQGNDTAARLARCVEMQIKM